MHYTNYHFFWLLFIEFQNIQRKTSAKKTNNNLTIIRTITANIHCYKKIQKKKKNYL